MLSVRHLISTLGEGQIVGITATLANSDEVASFLNASVFTTDFRPVVILATVSRLTVSNM